MLYGTMINKSREKHFIPHHKSGQEGGRWVTKTKEKLLGKKHPTDVRE